MAIGDLESSILFPRAYQDGADDSRDLAGEKQGGIIIGMELLPLQE